MVATINEFCLATRHCLYAGMKKVKILTASDNQKDADFYLQHRASKAVIGKARVVTARISKPAQASRVLWRQVFPVTK